MARKNYPGSIDQRGDTFRIRLMVDGKRHTFTIETTDRREAERVAMARYLALTQASPAKKREALGLAKDIRVSALLELFTMQKLPELAPGAQDAYEDSLKPIRKYFVDQHGDPSIDTIDQSVVLNYLAWRAEHRLKGKTRLANRTVAKDRAVLHRVFEYAVIAQLVQVNPVAATEAPTSDTKDPVILSPDEFEALVKQCHDRPMLELYVLTLNEAGLRNESEALWLQFPDVKLTEGFLWVASGRHAESRGSEKHRTKSGKGRWVPMTERLIEAMRVHFARYRFATYHEEPTPWVFHHEFARRHAKAGDRIRSLRSSFRAAARRAKLPDEFWQHHLRHRRITEWLGEGKNPVHVKEAVGHADLRTTMKYTHLSREHLRSLVDVPAKRKTSGRTKG